MKITHPGARKSASRLENRMVKQANPEEGVVSSVWSGISLGFRELVTFPVRSRALNSEYIFRSWRRWPSSEEPVQKQGGI